MLRIKPDPTTATYTIPAGNLFAPGEASTRPEIYAMGFRNPFRISVDKETGYVYVGDYGPDAGGPSATRGPGGQVEYSVLRAPGNFGWPYCTGDNDAFNDYDFATGQSGALFNCAAPANASPNNTGRQSLPPSHAAGHLVRQRRSRGRPRCSPAARSRRWAARSTTTTPPIRPRPSSPPTTTTTGSRTSGGATGSRRRRWTPPAARSR